MTFANKKGQMQMIEITIVMIIFFMLLGFGILFYTQFATREQGKTVSAVDRTNLVEAGKLLSSLPELHASYVGYESYSGIDYVRAQIFADTIREEQNSAGRSHYRDLFQGFSAELVCAYPTNCGQIGVAAAPLLLFNYTDPQAQSYLRFYVPVYIENPLYQRTGYGWITLTYATEARS